MSTTTPPSRIWRQSWPPIPIPILERRRLVLLRLLHLLLPLLLPLLLLLLLLLPPLPVVR